VYGDREVRGKGYDGKKKEEMWVVVTDRREGRCVVTA
jgi:hypothetical protein